MVPGFVEGNWTGLRTVFLSVALKEGVRSVRATIFVTEVFLVCHARECMHVEGWPASS